MLAHQTHSSSWRLAHVVFATHATATHTTFAHSLATFFLPFILLLLFGHYYPPFKVDCSFVLLLLLAVDRRRHTEQPYERSSTNRTGD